MEPELNESDEIVSYEIDLSAARNNQVNESWLRMFGSVVKMLMGHMFGGTSMPVRIKGSKQEVRAFAKTLSREKNYLKAWTKYGLDNPQTFRSKYKLNQAVKGFERVTGIKWPFK